MGISATSLVAAPALLSLKADQDPDDDTAAATARLGSAMVPNGKLANKASPAQASWADLVTGEEIGNVGTQDLGKIQQLLITLILLGAYAGYVFENFSLVSGVIGSLPSYTDAIKQKNIPPGHTASEYELDHLDSIEDGGDPSDTNNPWMQAYNDTYGARTKDVLETKVSHMVCAGTLTLDQARAALAPNWLLGFQQYVGPLPTGE
jgi:hypothetical protein